MSGANIAMVALGGILFIYSELHLFRDLFRSWELEGGKGSMQNSGEEL